MISARLSFRASLHIAKPNGSIMENRMSRQAIIVALILVCIALAVQATIAFTGKGERRLTDVQNGAMR